MHLLVSSDYYMNLENLWRGYPHLELDFYFKTYYLVQMSYWLQQMYFVQIEVRRKDYLNMISHHVITNSLVVFSYITNYTRVGHVMLVLMDFADIFLSTAKVLNYLRLKLICDITFTIFFISWIASRHIGFGMVMWSIMFDPEKVNPNEKWDPKNGIFYTSNTRRFFLVLLTALQILMFVWLWMILRVLIKVIVGTGAEDVRSSDEDDDVEHETKVLNEKKKA
ncbi:longevity-assurance protein [Neoconidiobolus thromboides FSU 785]|nr:longevity-assurance protein [Neoconidiobolus thromboides FSU 785]